MYELNDWLSNIHPQCFRFDKFDMDIFNDDRFGRSVEKASKADRATIITEVILIMIDKFGIKLDQLHNDSTTLKAYGKMPGKTESGLELKKGNSKDHRPDLKQMVYTLTVSADGAVPIHYKAYSGNHQTKKEGYKIHWIFTSEKKKRDYMSRMQSLAKTEKELITLLPKLNKRDLKTKQAIEERFNSILSKRNVEKYYSVSIEEIMEKESVQTGKADQALTQNIKRK